MTEKSEKLQAAYAQLADSEGGKNLMVWMSEFAIAKRRNAGKLEPVQAWGELKSADAVEEIVNHINVMRTPIKKR